MRITDQYRRSDVPDVNEYEFEGAFYEDAASLLKSGILGFCGCGPVGNANLAYVRAGLEHIAARSAADLSTSEQFGQMEASGNAVFGSGAARWFFYYWADKEELTTHGGCLPGWLTDKGKAVLEDLVAIAAEDQELG